MHSIVGSTHGTSFAYTCRGKVRIDAHIQTHKMFEDSKYFVTSLPIGCSNVLKPERSTHISVSRDSAALKLTPCTVGALP